MTVSLIVCTLGRITHLRRLLGSLRLSTTVPFEILVVDQNPPGFLDAVLAEFSDLPVARVVSDKGLSRARNVGLAVVRGEIVAFPDDDCWYPADVLSRVQNFFTGEPGCSLLTGRTTDASGATSVSPHLPKGATITRENVFKVGNSNGIFVRHALAQALGGFDETLGVGASSPYQSGEETDFVLRCLRASAVGRFDPTLVVHHDQGYPEAGRHLGRVQGYSAGFGRVLRKHGYGWPVVVAPVARATARAAICAARLDFDGALHRRAWIVGAIRGFTAPP